ncbi:hypothetical protein EJ110_NYTH51590 [Nymphaea thermarum]|nr:hypothetical protein EJ110_NYTH51590 [Nymphaea thermarum]
MRISSSYLAQKCEIAANIGCCGGCRDKIKRILTSIKGVETVDLYLEESKVVVTGKVDPGILLREVQKVKKKARLLTLMDASAKNLVAADDEYGGDSDHSETKKSANEVIPVKKEASDKAITVDKSTGPSKGGADITSERKTYGANLSAYGFAAGIYYSNDKSYKK